MKQNPGIRVIVIVIIFICLLITPAITQDIITTKTDETIKVKIIDVTGKMITYKEYDGRYDIIITVPISSLKLVEFVDYIPSRSQQIVSPSISSQKDSSKTSINITPAITQDIITTKTDETIKVKIIDVTDKTITYREYDDPYGMLITVPKSTLSEIQFIDYVPSESSHTSLAKIFRKEGSRNFFTVNGKGRYSFEELEPFLIQDQYAERHFKSYKHKKRTANVMGGMSIATIPIGLGIAAASGDIGGVVFGFLLVIGGAPIFGTIGIIALVTANRAKKKVIRTYGISNEDHSSLRSSRTEVPTMSLGLISSGVGVQVRF